MSEWKEYKLEKMGTVITGKTPSRNNPEDWGNEMPFVTPSDYKNYRKKVMNSERKLSKIGIQRLQNKILPKKSVLVTCIGSDMGKVVLNDIEVITNQQINSIIPNTKIVSNNFLYYRLVSMYETLRIYGGDGTAVPIVNKGDFENLETELPPLPEQKAIAEVLSSLDDKIDLLHRQNKTLEKIAETFFRQWFMEEAKEDWEERKLGDFTTVKRGGSPRPIQEYISDTGLRWLKISDATKTASPFIFEIKEHIKIEGLKKTTLLKAGSLVLSNSATPGIPKILQVDSCIHDGWLHFPQSHFSNEFLYLLFKKIRPELLMQGNGSIFTNLKTDILKEYPIPIPDDKSLTFFDNQVKLIFEKMLENQTQILTLEKMRGTLLPKLMSGEIRIKM